MKKDNEKETILRLAAAHTGNDNPSAGDIAKEIRARVADLNELVRVALKRNVVVQYTILEVSEFSDTTDYEELAVETFARV